MLAKMKEQIKKMQDIRYLFERLFTLQYLCNKLSAKVWLDRFVYVKRSVALTCSNFSSP
jgi:hypothetical protein